jgi:hypothetical protein
MAAAVTWMDQRWKIWILGAAACLLGCLFPAGAINGSHLI